MYVYTYIHTCISIYIIFLWSYIRKAFIWKHGVTPFPHFLTYTENYRFDNSVSTCRQFYSRVSNNCERFNNNKGKTLGQRCLKLERCVFSSRDTLNYRNRTEQKELTQAFDHSYLNKKDVSSGSFWILKAKQVQTMRLRVFCIKLTKNAVSLRIRGGEG